LRTEDDPPRGSSSSRSATHPIGGWRSGPPRFLYPAALLAERVGVVGELVLESELFAGVLSTVIDFGSPDSQGGQRLGL